MDSNIMDRHKLLMQEWKNKPLHKDCAFVEDGIVDLQRWYNSKHKVLVLLKEAYGLNENWSLTDRIREDWKGPRRTVFWMISYWLYLINKTNKQFIPLLPTEKEEYDECREFLLSAAIVNIKKSSGHSRSDDNDLAIYAENDKDLLRRQIKLIEPEIVICGYTKKFFDMFWDEKIEKNKNADLIYESNGIKIIDFWHPANQYPTKMNYYTFGALYQKILF